MSVDKADILYALKKMEFTYSSCKGTVAALRFVRLVFVPLSLNGSKKRQTSRKLVTRFDDDAHLVKNN